MHLANFSGIHLTKTSELRLRGMCLISLFRVVLTFLKQFEAEAAALKEHNVNHEIVP